ncbi:hypothetical protein J6590_053201 [Homalodisca vitripennis]|nr:hypothetical protein J6590_053201 [Homalodisca vitripennis]
MPRSVMSKVLRQYHQFHGVFADGENHPGIDFTGIEPDLGGYTIRFDTTFKVSSRKPGHQESIGYISSFLANAVMGRKFHTH